MYVVVVIVAMGNFYSNQHPDALKVLNWFVPCIYILVSLTHSDKMLLHIVVNFSICPVCHHNAICARFIKLNMKGIVEMLGIC